MSTEHFPSGERRFRAMGSDAHVIVVGDGAAALLDFAVESIDELERRWSRFLPHSEISLLNDAAGQPVSVTADTVALVQHSIEAWRLTGGAFDPTLLDALRAAGYDRTFAELPTHAAPPMPRAWDMLRPGPTDIVLDGDSVQLPAGMGFDAGGIGKGFAADLVAQRLIEDGAAGVCVNLGGDVRVRGIGPSGATWTLAIEHPWRPEPIVLVGLADGAIATSSVLRRVWSVGGERRHHLIDPATGLPAGSDLAFASVIAGEAWLAEVMAKAVLLRGSAGAFDLLDAGTAAMAVGHDDRVHTTSNFVAFTGGVVPPTITQPGSHVPLTSARHDDHSGLPTAVRTRT
jgi:thiamine biosynthesis lipoprotein